MVHIPYMDGLGRCCGNSFDGIQLGCLQTKISPGWHELLCVSDVVENRVPKLCGASCDECSILVITSGVLIVFWGSFEGDFGYFPRWYTAEVQIFVESEDNQLLSLEFSCTLLMGYRVSVSSAQQNHGGNFFWTKNIEAQQFVLPLLFNATCRMLQGTRL